MINEKDYKARTYINKRPKKKRTSKMCVNCSNCKNRKICKDRKDISYMKKCEICNNCTDKEHCDVFNFQIEHKVTIPIGRDEETGKIIRKSFSAQTESEAIYRSVQYQKTMVHSAEHTIIPRTKHSIVSIVDEYENRKLASGIIGETTKTANGERKILLTEITRPVLEDAIAKQIPNEYNLIFTTQAGKIYAESTINSGLKRILNNLNINTENISTHSLRHTFITRSNEAGVDAVATKTNVGHSNIHMTQDIYNENQDPYLTEQMKKYTEYMKEKMKI